MNSLLINASDIHGGAARATYRIHKGLQGFNIESKMLVQNKLGDDKTVIGPGNKLSKALALLRPALDKAFKNLLTGGSKSWFSPAWLPFSGVPSRIQSISPDIVHLNWVCDGMLRIEDIKRMNRPVIWTLHDMWAFTGGCHYSGDCDRFRQNCGNCPQLNNIGDNDLSRSIFSRKSRAWKKVDITVVTPSDWLAGCAKKSSLLRGRNIRVIPNGLNVDLFKPIDKTTGRRIWGLPITSKLILFGALKANSDPRKGFDLLYKSIKQFAAKWSNKVELVVFGISEPENPPDFGVPVHYIGHLQDDVSISLLYEAADVTVVPSRQEAFGQTAAESLSCGTPVVAFSTTGMLDIIDHQMNGYLAKPFDDSDLSVGIEWVLSNENRYKALCLKAREKAVSCFDINKVARQYAELYGEVLSRVKRN